MDRWATWYAAPRLCDATVHVRLERKANSRADRPVQRTKQGSKEDPGGGGDTISGSGSGCGIVTSSVHPFPTHLYALHSSGRLAEWK
jgi:hypothetical protein